MDKEAKFLIEQHLRQKRKTSFLGRSELMFTFSIPFTLALGDGEVRKVFQNDDGKEQNE